MEKREVVVIGGGMAGLLTAFFLQKEGEDVLLLEAKKVASGQTGRTTAKITSQHGLKYSNLIKKVGLAKARLYAWANEDAINMYERLIDDEGIECDFERVPAYLYSCRSSKAIEEEANGADCLGIDAFVTRKNQLPFDVKTTLCFPRQAQFTPLKFVGAIAGKLEIRENEMVRDIKGHRIITDKEELWADKIVVATHYPFINVPGFYFLRQHQERSYVLALKGTEPMDGMYYGIDDEGLSLRQEGRPYSIPAAKAKMVCTNAAMHVTTEAVQMLGGNGFMREYHVERMMRDAKITQIYEGTNEIQKLIISRNLFK